MKRFYGTVDIVAKEGGFAVTLDGKPMATPAKRSFRLPCRGFGGAATTETAAAEASSDNVLLLSTLQEVLKAPCFP